MWRMKGSRTGQCIEKQQTESEWISIAEAIINSGYFEKNVLNYWYGLAREASKVCQYSIVEDKLSEFLRRIKNGKVLLCDYR